MFTIFPLNIVPDLIFIVIGFIGLIFFITAILDFSKGKEIIESENYLTLDEFGRVIKMIPFGIGNQERFNTHLKNLDPITKIIIEKSLGYELKNHSDIKRFLDIISSLQYFKKSDEKIPDMMRWTKKQEQKDLFDYVEGNYFTTLTPFFNIPSVIFNAIYESYIYTKKHPLNSNDLNSISLIFDDKKNIRMLLSSRHFKEFFCKSTIYLSPLDPEVVNKIKSMDISIEAKAALRLVIVNEIQLINSINK